MSGHVLWLPSDIIKILDNLINLKSEEVSYKDYFEALQPILNQYAYNEQKAIICRLIQSGMKKEEIAKRLNYDISAIEEIVSLDIENDYDYRYIKGVSLFSARNLFNDRKQVTEDICTNNNINKEGKIAICAEELANALFLFAEGQITYDQANELSNKYVPQYDIDKYPMLGHKGINWYAKEILKAKGIVTKDYSWKHMEGKK